MEFKEILLYQMVIKFFIRWHHLCSVENRSEEFGSVNPIWIEIHRYP